MHTSPSARPCTLVLISFAKKKYKRALASVAQLVGALFGNQEVVCSIPGQGTYLGCAFGLQSRPFWEATLALMFLSFPLSLKSSEKNVLG